MNYYKRHLGDYAKDAGHLSLVEHGIYTLLLDRYYATEAPLTRDDAMRVCRARSKSEKLAVVAVLEEFFAPDGEAYRSKRADQEIAAHHEKSERNREAGKLGGRPPVLRGPKPKRFPAETQTVSEKNPSHKPLANSHKPEERESALTPDWHPPDWVKDRLRMAGRAPSWTPATVVSFVSYYEGRAGPPEGYGNAFVRWCLRERGGPTNGDAGEEAWEEFRAANRAGRMRDWSHPLTGRAIEAIGGWSWAQTAGSKDLDFKRQQFLATFKSSNP